MERYEKSFMKLNCKEKSKDFLYTNLKLEVCEHDDYLVIIVGVIRILSILHLGSTFLFGVRLN